MRIALLTLLALGVTGCLRVSRSGVSVAMPLPAATGIAPRTVEFSSTPRGGELTPAQMEAIAPQVRSLRAEPQTLEQTVGDTVALRQQVRVFALDGTGSLLGELSYYDFGFSGRGLRLLPDGRFVFGRAGTVEFVPRFPEASWKGRPSARPGATVTITVYRDQP